MAPNIELLIEEEATFGSPAKVGGGMKLSLAQANIIVQRHLPSRWATRISYIDRGYNNKVYVVSTVSGTEVEEKDYILRLTGDFWGGGRTENEVCALLHLWKNCPSVPIPKIVGYCTDKGKSGLSSEYILMERMLGEPLDLIWNKLDVEKKMTIVSQLAPIFGEIQKEKFEKIGSFQFKSNKIRSTCGIGVDPKKDIIEVDDEIIQVEDKSPNNFRDYIRSSLESQLNYLKGCKFMRGAEDYWRRLDRLERFTESFQKLETVSSSMDKNSLENVPIVMAHGDLEPQNILVDKDTLKITGLIDFEWTGASTIDSEWYSGFYFVDSATPEWQALNENEPAAEQDPVKDNEKNMLKEHFITEMRKNGVAVPSDIPGHLLRAELYYFREQIYPWWFREQVDTIPQSHYGDRVNACTKVDKVLDKYGF